MKQLLKSKDKFSMGIDFGTSTTKIIKLKFMEEKVELCSFEVVSQADTESVLKKIMESSPEVKRINMSVAGPSAIIRYADFPLMKQEELRQSLKFEAPRYIPFKIDEINLDSYILKELSESRMRVLMAAAKKDLIEQRLKLMENARIKVSAIDIDSLALINAFNFNYEQDEELKNNTLALLNIGAALSNLNILENNIPCLSRDIHIAGSNFTQKIADNFGLDFESAEDLKINPAQERQERMSKAGEAVLSSLATELRVSFDYYESQSSGSVEKIFLSGGGSLFVGLKDALANILGLGVEYWDPLKQINIPGTMDSPKIKRLSNSSAVAVGLALRQ